MNVYSKVTVILTLEEARELRRFLDYPVEVFQENDESLPETLESLMVQLP